MTPAQLVEARRKTTANLDIKFLLNLMWNLVLKITLGSGPPFGVADAW
jgi:hypothetical protein